MWTAIGFVARPSFWRSSPDVIVTDAATHIVEQFSLLGVGPDEIEWMWEARR